MGYNNYGNRGNNRGNNPRNGGNRGRAGSDRYVGAPYNFVPFSEEVHEYKREDRPEHNSVDTELYSGEIPYTICAKTPIIIDDGNGHFYRDNYGRYAIPGSSVRGLIRSNVQVLSLSGVDDDIDDYSLMYRNVSDPKMDDYGTTLGADSITIDNGTKSQQISVLKKVRAGYVEKKNGKYWIYETKVDSLGEEYDRMNYYVLSERKVVTEYRKAHREKRTSNYEFFAPGGRSIMEYTVNRDFDQFLSGKESDVIEQYIDLSKAKKCNISVIDGRKPGTVKAVILPSGSKNTGEEAYLIKEENLARLYRQEADGYHLIVQSPVHYAGQENDYYRPYHKACSYEVDGTNVTHVGEPDEYTLNGYAVSTGKMNEKKAIYIIPELNSEKAPFEIRPEDVKAFEIDLNNKKTQLKKLPYGRNISWGDAKSGWEEPFALPEEGEKNRKPIFYISDSDRLYFGFTPQLRLFYKHSIKDGLSESQRKPPLDYAKAIFGYSNLAESYKSRVSFSDARLVAGGDEEQSICVVQGAPKPSSYADYIVSQNGKMTSYNAENFRLRGIKQYWLRSELDREHMKIEDPNSRNAAGKPFTPFSGKAKFEGKVRFHNLRRDELGLLLWALALDGKSWMNIGKGKAFGFGNIVLKPGKVQVVDPEKAYKLESLNCQPFTELSVDELIADYKATINKSLNGRNIDTMDSVKTFFLMKSPDHMPDSDKIHYMSIDNKDYQSRKQPLQTVEQVLGLVSTPATGSGSSYSRNSSYGRNDTRRGNGSNSGRNDAQRGMIQVQPWRNPLK